MADDFTLLKVFTLDRFKSGKSKHTKLNTFMGKLYHHATNRVYILGIQYNKVDIVDDTMYFILLYDGRGTEIAQGHYKTNDTIVFDELYIPKAISDKKNRLLGDIEQFILDILI